MRWSISVAFSAFAMLGCTRAQISMKHVQSTDNLVSIQLPRDWIVETEDPRTILTYPPGSPAALRMTSLGKKAGGDPDTAPTPLRGWVHKGEGRWINAYSELSKDEQGPLQMHYWWVAQRTGTSVLVAIFSYSHDPVDAVKVNDELELVRRQIEHASFDN